MCFDRFSMMSILNYHFRNEQRLWEKNGRGMHPKLFDYLCGIQNEEFQRIMINFFLILFLANQYNYDSLNKWEFCEKNPTFLHKVYSFRKKKQKGFQTIKEWIACDKYVSEEYSLFVDITFDEYRYYMNILYQYYEMNEGKIPYLLYKYLENSKEVSIQKYFLDWYIPSLESLRGFYVEAKENFLQDNQFYLQKFFLAENLMELKEFFIENK